MSDDTSGNINAPGPPGAFFSSKEHQKKQTQVRLTRPFFVFSFSSLLILFITAEPVPTSSSSVSPSSLTRRSESVNPDQDKSLVVVGATSWLPVLPTSNGLVEPPAEKEKSQKRKKTLEEGFVLNGGGSSDTESGSDHEVKKKKSKKQRKIIEEEGTIAEVIHVGEVKMGENREGNGEVDDTLCAVCALGDSLAPNLMVFCDQCDQGFFLSFFSTSSFLSCLTDSGQDITKRASSHASLMLSLLTRA